MEPEDTPALLSPTGVFADNTDTSAEVVSATETVYRNGLPPIQSYADIPSFGHKKACALEGIAHAITLPKEEDVSVGTPGCQRCEVLPLPITDQPGILTLRFPHTHTLGKILEFLAGSAYRYEEHDGNLRIHVQAGGIIPLMTPVLERLSSAEQRDTRAYFQPDRYQRSLNYTASHFEIKSLPDFANRLSNEWLLRLLREERFYSVFQPILDGNTAKVFGYECLLRGRGEKGLTVPPDLMLKIAHSADLLFQFDLAARRTAIQSAAEHGIAQDHKIFINFVPSAIYNPKTCLDSTVRLVDELGIKRSQVVFEIIESERLPELPHLRRIVDYYRAQGFGVALDDVGAGFSSLSALAALRPDYVKIDRSLLQGVHKDTGRAIIARKLLEIVQELEILSVAEGIETEEEFAWAKEHGADYVQGYLFARPAKVPPLRG
ncbi:MAG: EAL domain-containing protein [Armatimonadota bacterium]